MPLASLAGQPWSLLEGECIDAIPLTTNQYTYSDDSLKAGGPFVSEVLVSHLLKSNCPVTNQPDWASVQVSYTGTQMDRESLLRTIISFRLHQGFHEQCIEQLFYSISKQCQPETLAVLGCFTRRGGLDINPYRSTVDEALPEWGRVVRQ